MMDACPHRGCRLCIQKWCMDGDCRTWTQETIPKSTLQHHSFRSEQCGEGQIELRASPPVPKVRVRARMGSGRRSSYAALVAAGADGHAWTSPALPWCQEPIGRAVLWRRQGGPGCFGQLPDLPAPQTFLAGCSQLRCGPE